MASPGPRRQRGWVAEPSQAEGVLGGAGGGDLMSTVPASAPRLRPWQSRPAPELRRLSSRTCRCSLLCSVRVCVTVSLVTLPPLGCVLSDGAGITSCPDSRAWECGRPARRGSLAPVVSVSLECRWPTEAQGPTEHTLQEGHEGEEGRPAPGPRPVCTTGPPSSVEGSRTATHPLPPQHPSVPAC